MFDPVLVLGTVLGIDSFLIGAAVGPVIRERPRRWAMALAFGVCDGLAILVGFHCGPLAGVSLAWCEWAGVVAVGLYGVLVVVLCAWGRGAAADGRARWLPLVLPAVMSLDNLAAGVGLAEAGTLSVAPVLLPAVLSSLLAACGLSVGAALGGACPARRGWLAGSALLGVAGVLCARELMF